MKPSDKKSDMGLENCIECVKEAIEDVSAGDFEKVSADIPVDAEDGAQVALLFSGTVKDGKLSDAYMTQIDIADMGAEEEDGEEKPSGIAKVFGSEKPSSEKD